MNAMRPVNSFPRLSGGFLIVLAALVATAAKLYCAATTIGTNDAIYFLKFASDIDEIGVTRMYLATPLFNHTPMVAEMLVTLLHIALNTRTSFFFWLRLPGIIADFTSVLALLWVRGKTGNPPYWALALFALSPVSFMISGYHGNVDSILVMFILLAACARLAGKSELCGILLGLSCNVKVVPLVLLPVFLLSWRSRQSLWRFVIPFGGVVIVGWGIALLQTPVAFVRNVLSYAGYWGEWGITCGLHATGLPMFQPLGFTALTVEERIVMLVLKMVIVGGITLLAWKRRDGQPVEVFSSLALAWVLFFVFAPGVGPQYLVWFAPFLLLHAPRWYAFVTAVCSVFLGVYYTVISHGLPWNVGLSTLQLAPLLRPWTALPWAALVMLLTFSFREILGTDSDRVDVKRN